MQDSSSVRSKDYTLHQMLLIKQVGQSQTDAKGLHPFGLDKKGAPICPNLWCRHLGHFFHSSHFIQWLRIQNIVKELSLLIWPAVCLQIVLLKWGWIVDGFAISLIDPIGKNGFEVFISSEDMFSWSVQKVIKKTDKTGHLGTLMPCWFATSDNTMRRRVVVA